MFHMHSFRSRCWVLIGWFLVTSALADDQSLRISVYATAGDVLRHLGSDEQCERVLAALKPLGVSRLFLEGRRGDEYVPAAQLGRVRDFFLRHQIQSAGAIATVPGADFGIRQNEALGWLNWTTEKTQRDVAAFFAENAPVFDELIVDDFFCTADTSPVSAAERGPRDWGEYRRELLVSLIQPVMLQPARRAHPSVRLIIKFPQWYDRFHLFGYDPVRMAAPFDQVWVGTEVRNPQTRRMGFVQPTEGYINFRWLRSAAGSKVRGAWFDHIECTAQNFVDQAFQSVLAGARELTLFRLGDLMENHPGDALLAAKLPELRDLAGKVGLQNPRGIAFYKPPDSDAGENLYLMDYLAMIGLPILPAAAYPEPAPVAVLGQQAAADPQLLEKMRRHLALGRRLVLTPALVRALGRAGDELAGVRVGSATPAVATEVLLHSGVVPLGSPLDLEAGLAPSGARVVASAAVGTNRVPVLTLHRQGQGSVLVLNVRTFSEQDFRDSNEWLLAPKPRGLSQLPEAVANEIRQVMLEPLDWRFEAPAGVALYLFDRARCLYNFHDRAVSVRLNGRLLELGANQCVWAPL